MMMHRFALLSSLVTLATAQVGTSSEINGGGLPPPRTYMTVEFDYKLEANQTTQNVEAAGGDNIFSEKPLEDALLNIETDFIPTIQERLPNGEIPEGKTLPDVKFNSVTSRFINMCFTESDACKWVKCRIKLSFADDRPMAAMERTTLNLAREYLQDMSNANEMVRTTFVYPMIHSSTIQLDFSPVQGTMSDTDILDLESSFYNVYHAIVGALDGDTAVSEAHFVYQAIEDDKLSVNLKYYGKCRYCTEEELAEVVNDQIKANTNVFLTHLKGRSEGWFFKTVQDVAFSIPTSFGELPPIDVNIFDAEAPSANKKFPYFLLLGAVAATIVICTGIVVICKDQKELRKEEASTGEESESYDGNHHEGARSNDSDDIDDIEGNPSLNTNGMHEDYQVYVY